jgi:hypothetical protein
MVDDASSREKKQIQQRPASLGRGEQTSQTENGGRAFLSCTGARVHCCVTAWMLADLDINRRAFCLILMLQGIREPNDPTFVRCHDRIPQQASRAQDAYSSRS